MQLGLTSAIVPDLSFDELLAYCANLGLECVEVMCWPPGTAERRYAGVTHLDVTAFDKSEAGRIEESVGRHGVRISALGYYPNPLDPVSAAARAAIEHVKKVIRAAERLPAPVRTGPPTVTTFIGRDPAKSIDDNWPAFRRVWRPLVKFAEDHGVRLAIENCPMLFSRDEWPGGKNLAVSPAVWRRMFEEIPSTSFGLNYDPSHLVWQHIDYVAPLREFAARVFHVHAKDTRIDRHRLDDVGVLGFAWHTPKLPGLGDVHWGRFFSVLTDAGYDGPVTIEVEDRAYEQPRERLTRGIRHCVRFLRQFV